MKSPAELLAFYLEYAEESFQWADTHQRNGNWPSALGNWTSAANSRFFRALVGWRTGLLDPVPELQAARAVSEAALHALDGVDVGPLRPLFDPVPGAYAAILLAETSSAVAGETRRLAVRPAPSGVTVDRTLDGWLIGVLIGHDAGPGPAVAMDMQGKKRTTLVGETYSTYFDLAALSADDVLPATELTRQALGLFARRRKDPYYSNGLNYEGGGMYNDVVIDFHLAAIWHVRGWGPTGLTPEERLHVQLPSAGPGAP